MNYELWILNYYDEQLSHSSTSNDLLREEKIQEYCIFQIINKIRMNKG